ncbi:MAG: cobalt transporter CbiM [Rhodospirillaceae bacterium]
MEHEDIPRVGVLSGVLFTASLVHFPVGPTSVHLVLNGLTGVVLGWAAFPAILVALLLQAMLFGFGGLVVLGVNVTNLAVPALLCRGVFLLASRYNRPGLSAALAGGLGVLLTAGMVALSLALSGREFETAAKMVILAHLPVALIEGVFTAAAVGLLLRVKPDILEGRMAGKIAAAVVVGVLMSSGPAAAHKLELFATAEGTVIAGYAYAGSGDRVKDATVTVTAAGGAPVVTLKTDSEGNFRFEARQRVDHLITADTVEGHHATFTVRAADLPESASESSALDFRVFIDRSVARQIRPLREQLDSFEDAVWMHDILGGLGVIFGVFGVAYGVSARRRRLFPDTGVS